jgi:hypothetical protein
MKRIIFLIIFLYFLALFQVSFLVHLKIFGAILNFSLVFVIFFNFFEASNKKRGLLVGGIEGFFLDALSSFWFGPLTFLYFSVACFVKRLSAVLEKKSVFSFLLVLIFALIFYYLVLEIFVLLFKFPVRVLVQEGVYNFFVGLAAFLIYVFFKKQFRG